MSPLPEQTQLRFLLDRSSILKILNHTSHCREVIPVAPRPQKNYWMYDHTKLIYREDNLNKKTFIDIPDHINRHSLMVPVKIR